MQSCHLTKSRLAATVGLGGRHVPPPDPLQMQMLKEWSDRTLALIFRAQCVDEVIDPLRGRQFLAKAAEQARSQNSRRFMVSRLRKLEHRARWLTSIGGLGRSIKIALLNINPYRNYEDQIRRAHY